MVSEQRVLPEQLTWSQNQVAVSSNTTMAPLESGVGTSLAISILLVLALERFIAVKRNQ